MHKQGTLVSASPLSSLREVAFSIWRRYPAWTLVLPKLIQLINILISLLPLIKYPPQPRCRFHQRFSFASMRLVTSACSPSTRGRPQPPSTESTTAGAHTTLHTSHMHSHAHPHPHTPTYAPTYIRMSTTPITPTMPLCLQAHLPLIKAPF